jgi:hypothetical protein
MDGKMKTLAQIICVSAIFLAPVARIGAGDDVQIPSLFDQVRSAIPKLKAGMSEAEGSRSLHLDKLRGGGIWTSGLVCGRIYGGFAKNSQRLHVLTHDEDNAGKAVTMISAILYDGDKIVAQFNDNKK